MIAQVTVTGIKKDIYAHDFWLGLLESPVKHLAEPYAAKLLHNLAYFNPNFPK